MPTATSSSHAKFSDRLTSLPSIFTGGISITWRGGSAEVYCKFGRVVHAAYTDADGMEKAGIDAVDVIATDLPARYTVRVLSGTLAPGGLKTVEGVTFQHFRMIVHNLAGREVEAPRTHRRPAPRPIPVAFAPGDAPPMPAGPVVFGPESAADVRVSYLPHLVQDGLLSYDGPEGRAHAICRGGSIAACVWSSGTETLIGSAAGLRLSQARAGQLTMYRLDADVVQVLPMLWLAGSSESLDASIVDPRALMDKLTDGSTSSAIRFDGPTARGVSLFLEGSFLATYTEEDPVPSRDAQTFACLVNQAGTRLTILRWTSIPSAPAAAPSAHSATTPHDDVVAPTAASPMAAFTSLRDEPADIDDVAMAPPQPPPVLTSLPADDGLVAIPPSGRPVDAGGGDDTTTRPGMPSGPTDLTPPPPADRSQASFGASDPDDLMSAGAATDRSAPDSAGGRAAWTQVPPPGATEAPDVGEAPAWARAAASDGSPRRDPTDTTAVGGDGPGDGAPVGADSAVPAWLTALAGDDEPDADHPGMTDDGPSSEAASLAATAEIPVWLRASFDIPGGEPPAPVAPPSAVVSAEDGTEEGEGRAVRAGDSSLSDSDSERAGTDRPLHRGSAGAPAAEGDEADVENSHAVTPMPAPWSIVPVPGRRAHGHEWPPAARRRPAAQDAGWRVRGGDGADVDADVDADADHVADPAAPVDAGWMAASAPHELAAIPSDPAWNDIGVGSGVPTPMDMAGDLWDGVAPPTEPEVGGGSPLGSPATAASPPASETAGDAVVAARETDWAAFGLEASPDLPPVRTWAETDSEGYGRYTVTTTSGGFSDPLAELGVGEDLSFLPSASAHIDSTVIEGEDGTLRVNWQDVKAQLARIARQRLADAAGPIIDAIMGCPHQVAAVTAMIRRVQMTPVPGYSGEHVRAMAREMNMFAARTLSAVDG